MGKRVLSPVAALAAFAFVTTLALAPAVSAQGTPGAVSAPDTDSEAQIELHPAHIHAGTCDELGDVVYPLNELQAAASVDDPDATPVIDMGATPDAAAAVGLVDVAAQSSTQVDVSLEDLLVEDYAINVHESPENIQTFIACGEISGTADGGELSIELSELNNSNVAGQAELSDQGDGTTIVHVTIFPGEDTGTPEATPAS